MNSKRTKIQIYADILRALKNSEGRLKKTHIVYKANLTHKRLDEYLLSLLEKKFICEITVNGKKYFKITKKGENLLHEIRKLKEISDAFGIRFF